MKRFAPKNILIGLIRLYQKLRPAGTRGCCKYLFLSSISLQYIYISTVFLTYAEASQNDDRNDRNRRDDDRTHTDVQIALLMRHTRSH